MHTGGMCRPELASKRQPQEPVLATPLPCLQIGERCSGGISADDCLALHRDEPGVADYHKEPYTAVCHLERSERPLSKYESSKLSESRKQQLEHESPNPGWCSTILYVSGSKSLQLIQ